MLEDYVEERLKSLGAAIKLARKERGLRQRDLAAFAEIDRSHLQKIEGGSNTSMSTLFRICFVLEIDESNLFKLITKKGNHEVRDVASAGIRRKNGSKAISVAKGDCSGFVCSM